MERIIARKHGITLGFDLNPEHGPLFIVRDADGDIHTILGGGECLKTGKCTRYGYRRAYVSFMSKVREEFSQKLQQNIDTIFLKSEVYRLNCDNGCQWY